MHNSEAQVAEQKLNRLANMALYHQSLWVIMVIIILVLKPTHMKTIGQGLGMAALIASFLSSKIYIQAGKKVEEFKTFSPEEWKERKNEYTYRFFLPYFFWAAIITLFSF